MVTVAGIEQLEVLDRGGFATVYRGVETASGQPVAVKVLDRTGEVEEGRFARERESLSRLSQHPNIVRVLSGGRTGEGAPYLVLELVAGGSVAGLLDRMGHLDAHDSAWIADQMLAALEFAHASGVLHRDVKPSNMLIGNGAVKLADFGIARFVDATQTTNAVAQTIAFAAPEILRGDEATNRSDLYSLGASLATMVTGRMPTATWQDAMAKAASGEALDIDLTSAPSSIEEVVRSLVASDPADRPASAQEVRALLAPAVPSGPSTAIRAAVNAQVHPLTAPQLDSPTAYVTVVGQPVDRTAAMPSHTSEDRGESSHGSPRRMLALVAAVVGLALVSVGAAVWWPLGAGTEAAVDGSQLSGEASTTRPPTTTNQAPTSSSPASSQDTQATTSTSTPTTTDSTAAAPSVLNEDGDGDGLNDDVDHCPSDSGPAKFGGCPDGDGDGVPFGTDLCAETPAGIEVGESGCPLVPLLTGLSLDEAAAELEARGFKWETAPAEVPYGSTQAGAVVEQSVPMGAEADAGSTVLVRWGKQPPLVVELD